MYNSAVLTFCVVQAERAAIDAQRAAVDARIQLAELKAKKRKTKREMSSTAPGFQLKNEVMDLTLD